MKKKAGSFGLWTVAILAIGIALYGLVLYGLMDGSESGFVQQKKEMELSGSWLVWLTIHAAAGSLALLTGWLQFVKRIRTKYLKMHRLLGIFYTLTAVAAGITGLYLAIYASGGFAGKLGFGVLSIAWLTSTIYGVIAIVVHRNPLLHGQWMLRSYALSFAAVTLRIYLPLSMVMFGFESYNVYYAVIAWICWVPNLLFAGWIIRRRARRQPPAA